MTEMTKENTVQYPQLCMYMCFCILGVTMENNTSRGGPGDEGGEGQSICQLVVNGCSEGDSTSG